MTKLEQLAEVTAWAGGDLPDDYLDVLRTHGGEFCNDFVRLYAVDEIIERNETYETKQYCPGFITIGDDSGGRAIVIALARASGPVYIVGHGLMTPDGFVTIAPDMQTWVANGCAIDE